MRGGIRKRRCFLLHDGVHDFDGRLPREGALTGEHLVQHDAIAEDVRAMVDGGRCVSVCSLRVACGSKFAAPKSRNPDVAIARDEQIFRFQIAMHDGLCLCGREAMRELNFIVDHPADLEDADVRSDVVDRQYVRVIQGAARASCSKRRRRSVFPAIAAGGTLMAISRASRASCAIDIAHAAGVDRRNDLHGPR